MFYQVVSEEGCILRSTKLMEKSVHYALEPRWLINHKLEQRCQERHGLAGSHVSNWARSLMNVEGRSRKGRLFVEATARGRRHLDRAAGESSCEVGLVAEGDLACPKLWKFQPSVQGLWLL